MVERSTSELRPAPVNKEGRTIHGLLFPIRKVFFYAPSHKQDSTCHGLCYTSHGAVAGTRNSSRCRLWRIDPTTHRTMSERSYHGATSSSHIEYFSFQPVLHDWYNKGRGMCYPVWGMVHIKEPLLLIGKTSLCGGSGFPFSLSEWSLTICLTPYNRK